MSGPGPDRAHPTGDSGGVPGRLPLVGRDHELAALEGLMEQRERNSSLVILSGEGGVGKSRLVAELAERAAPRGWTVLTGRAYPVETGVPYALFADAFVPVLREMEPERLSVLSRGGEAELYHLFPALADPADRRVASMSASDPEEFRTRLLWNFAEFVKSLAGRSPLLIVLEDLQWADESSLALLHFTARHAVGAPVLAVATYNDAERDRVGRLVQTERSLTSLGIAQTRRLEPLTRDDVSELVCRTFDVDPSLVREFTALLFGWSRGNPFFVEEIVKSLVASGRLSNQKGTWVGWGADDFALPRSVRDAVLDRASRFSENARSVAELAAVIGARASYPLLESISGLAGTELLAALDELCGQGVLEERAEAGAVVYDFAHPIVRQTLYEELGLQRARLRHESVAEAMEAFYGDEAIEHADELAFHFARTDARGLEGKAIRYLAEAGRRAVARGADREAAKYLRTALERLPANAPGEQRVELLRPLGAALLHLGDFEEAVALWADALALVPDGSALHADVRRTLGLAHFFCGRHAEAHEHFEAGRAAAEASGGVAELVGLLLGHGYCLQEIGRAQEALETIRLALPLAQDGGDPRLLARVHRSLALLHVWAGPPDDAHEHAQRAIDLAAETGDSSVEFWARWGLAVLEGMTGDTDAMARGIDEMNALADRVRSPVLRLWTADMEIELAFGLGEWDRGVALGEQLVALARNLNQRTLLPRLLVWTSLFHSGRGELERARALVDEAVEVSGLEEAGEHVDVHVVVPAYIGLAHYYLAVGDYGQAIQAALQGLAIAERAGYTLWVVHRLLPVLAETYFWAERIEEGAAVAARLRSLASKMNHQLGIAWADAGDALVTWKRGDPERAIPMMRAAAEALERIPMIPYGARIRRLMALRMIEVGDDDGAREELRRIHGVFERLGAGIELEKTRTHLRELGTRPPPKGTGKGAAGLTVRELEVARAASRGLSNKGVARELDMAVRTASTHLSNIYKKLELGSRNELAAWMRSEGLVDD